MSAALESERRRYRAYIDQKFNSRKRRIGFHFSFAEWWEVWQRSGHWHERGCRRGQYVMARKLDRGPYERGNVEIVTVEANLIGRPISAATRRRIGRAVRRWRREKREAAA